MAVLVAVNNHWTGLVDWTGGLDYWTDLWCRKQETAPIITTKPYTQDPKTFA